MLKPIVIFAFGLAAATASPASAGLITADFKGNLVGQFVSSYEESGIVFTSDGGAGLSFLINILNGDIGLFEVTASGQGGPFGVNAVLPALADSVTVSFYLAHDDEVTLTAFDEQGIVIDQVSEFGPPDPLAYLDLTVSAPNIARIHWIASIDKILVAGEVTANVVPAPGGVVILLLSSVRIRRRR